MDNSHPRCNFSQLNLVYAIWDWATKGIIYSLMFGFREHRGQPSLLFGDNFYSSSSCFMSQWPLYIGNGNITIQVKGWNQLLTSNLTNLSKCQHRKISVSKTCCCKHFLEYIFFCHHLHLSKSLNHQKITGPSNKLNCRTASKNVYHDAVYLKINPPQKYTLLWHLLEN